MPDPTTPAPLPDTPEQLLAELGEIAGMLEHLEGLYARRLALYRHARTMAPAITMARLAEASNVTEVAVIQTLRKAKERDERRRAG